MLQALEYVRDEYPLLRVVWKANIKETTSSRPWIYRSAWLPSASRSYGHSAVKAIVYHGGGNTFNEATLHGLPQLVVPQWQDGFDYGLSVEKLGLGLQTTYTGPELDAEGIGARLLQLLNDRLRFVDSVKLWQAKARAAGGAELAANVIIGEAEKQKVHYMKILGKREGSAYEVV